MDNKLIRQVNGKKEKSYLDWKSLFNTIFNSKGSFQYKLAKGGASMEFW